MVASLKPVRRADPGPLTFEVAADEFRQTLPRNAPSSAPEADPVARAGPCSGASPEQRKLQAVWEHAGDAMLFLDRDGVLDCNDAGLRLFGLESGDSLLGQPLHAFAPACQPDGNTSQQAFADGVRQTLRTGCERFEWVFQRNDRSPLILDVILHAVQMGGGQVAHGIFRDVTLQRQAARQLELNRQRTEARLHHLAHHDGLTGLPNRAQFMAEGRRLLSAPHPSGSVCLLSLDIDNFSAINDGLGHAIGDQLLREVATRIQRHLPGSHLAARLGGDEFAVLLPGWGADETTALAQRLSADICVPIEAGRHRLSITSAIGISHVRDRLPDLESLMQQADIAMHVAKQAGRGNCRLFAEDLHAHVRDRLSLESHLQGALERREFELYYQPQIDLPSRAIVGVEALIRWNHPLLGRVSPDRFIPLAEHTGLIEHIGEWVLREACRQNVAWQQGGIAPLRMSVNVSARQFQRPRLQSAVAQALAETGLAPDLLELELTESTLMEALTPTMQSLSALRNLGVTLAIDDFGTGYSSLAYLKRFPIDRLKLDRSFVSEIDRDPDYLAIAHAVIHLGHNLRLGVIAEGVETRSQLDLLQRHQCEQAQGFLFAHPLSARDMETMLRADENPAPRSSSGTSTTPTTFPA